MRMRRRGARMAINGEINVVSLIDVMMLLMVIFMITAPIMQGGVDVNLPKAAAKPLESTGGMVVSVTRDGKIYVDDTYNSKLKIIDLKDKTVTTLIGPVKDDKSPPFNEPGGISHANGKLYVADTNAHRIRVVDLKTLKVSTLSLTGVEPPPPQKEWQPRK